MPPANLTFLPWTRSGAAGAITAVDSFGPAQPAAADLSIALSVNGAPLPPVPVRLRGPADVVGLDAHQVLRTDPRPGTNDFEPNGFPAIELDRADFPWLFTPARATAEGRLRPWLCLIVLRVQDGVQLTNTPGAPLPVLTVTSPARAFDELPDLKESWAWAHAQVAAGGASDANALRAALDGAPHLSLSRLICPRLLAADTAYLACVVPTFELGRRAGLGLPIADADLVAANALAPAWTLTASAPAQIQLPVYYSWQFRTGEGGDFASLARRLTLATPERLGQRTVLIGQPGFALPAAVPRTTTVEIEGALLPMDGGGPVVWSDPVAPAFEQALAAIVNQPGLNQVIAPADDPLLAPPLYGRWHAGRAVVTPGSATWFDALNLDPRWRSAAALGTRIVQEHQEALMASAWEQAAEIQPVNQRLRQLQLSMTVGERLHARHLSVMSEEMTLRFAAPVFSRIRLPASDPRGRTLTAALRRSSLPVGATRTAMRRLGRQRGPLTRRVLAQGQARSAVATWVARLNLGDAAAPAPRPPVDHATLPPLPTVDAVTNAIWRSSFVVTPEGQPPAPPPPVDPLPPAWDYPGHFRAAAAAHLALIRPRVAAAFVPHITMAATVGIVREQMHPRVALARLVRATVSTGDNVLQPSAPGVTPIGTETVMMTPSFPQPMYEPLKEISQDLLLPGLDAVQPDSVVGLRTNRAFVEAFMIGLNVEMARELLWRGFPTDQQGTYFTRFWAAAAGARNGADIEDLRKNLGRPLGAAPAQAAAEQFVLLLKSSLLRRYPNATIYLTPDAAGTANPPRPDIFPIFTGTLDPDVTFVGFPILPATAIGTATQPGYFVVIQEHPTEPRFGLDVAVSATLGDRSHLAIGTHPPAGLALGGHTWGRNAAHMAEITRRRPVRITIHASQLVRPS